MVRPPSGPKKFCQTHWLAGLGAKIGKNWKNEVAKKQFKVSIFDLFSLLVGQTQPRGLPKTKIGDVAASCWRI